MGLVEIVPKEDEFWRETTVRLMIGNAFLIPSKIAGAADAGLYDLKMENAALMRKAAIELYVHAGSLRFEECITDKDYIELLRNTIDEFKLLFIDKISGFYVGDYIEASWGLFNPPGVNVNDKDPDNDDIPFDPDDFFDNY
jgi:hypothetical protein